MKVNDYVKYQDKIYIIKKSRLSCISNSIWYTLDFEKGLDAPEHYLTLLTPEETLEMFKGRFEELGYELHKEEDVFIVTKKGGMFINLVILEDEINFEVETTKVKNTLIDLIREFQNWYWRDK